jgi:hypothetical protein
MLRVVFVGAHSDEIREMPLPKHFDIRKSNISRTIKFLCDNNPHYSNVKLNIDMLENEQYVQDVQYTSSSDDLDRIIPHTNQFEIIEEQLSWAKRNGMMIEEISKAGLMTLNAENMDYRRIEIAASMNTWLKHANDNGLNAIIHDYGILDSQTRTSWLSESYPELFPYGYTGPEAKRPRKIEFQQLIQHLLQISDPRFREHHDFVFTAFNYIQRLKVTHSLK